MPDAKDDSSPCLTAECAQKLLLDVGLSVAQTGVFDPETQMAVRASKLHFTPECYDEPEGCTIVYDPKIAIALDNVASGRWVTSRSESGAGVGLTLGIVFGSLLGAFLLLHTLYKCKQPSERDRRDCFSRWFSSRRSDEQLPLRQYDGGVDARPPHV